MSPQEFVRKWKAVELSERSAAQSHFIDLCKVFDHPAPTDDDPTGDHFAFEKGLTKTGGGDGFADVWKKGFFAWEYKKKKRNLDAALEQLSRYAAALEYPPLHVACDMDRIVIVTAWTNTVPERHTFSLDDLAAPENFDKLHAVFHDPEKLRPQKTRQAVTAEAATKFVTIAERLQHREADSEAVAHFVNQLVFCFFAEDVRLLPEDFFGRILRQAARRPERCKEYLDKLFAAMEEGGDFDLTEIRHFNGGLFDGRRALRLEQDEIGLLVAAGSLDWGQIDPTIFGTLFERFLDPEKRAQIGAHYTDTEKIMMIVEPVILRPLRKEWDAARAEIAKLVNAAVGLRGRSFDNAMKKAEERRAQFLERLQKVSILDPACGSGNFLYLALQGVKDIEHRANLECEALGLKPQAPMVGPEILHGIEINRHAAELARTTIWIGHIQWAIRNGIHAWPSPILRRLDTIEARDALIERDDSGQWHEAKWPEAEFIVGNPPFLGDRFHRRDLGESYTAALRSVFEGRLPARADLVAYWFEKAVPQLLSGPTRAVGLVATKSIAKGASRVPLDKVDSSDQLRIFDAWTNEPWIVDGALVRVALVCFGKIESYSGVKAILNGIEVARINSDLTSGVDLTQSRALAENGAVAFQGVKLTGPFDLAGPTARDWLRLPLNPNGRSNSDVLRRFMDIDDITGRSTDRWVIDFSDFADRSKASLYEAPFEYIERVVRPFRFDPQKTRSTERRLRDLYWIFQRPRPTLRRAIRNHERIILVPETTEHRIFVWGDSRDVFQGSLFVIAREDDTSFGILHSALHDVWATGQGNRLGVGNQRRYNITRTFETYPFPEGLTPNILAKDYADDPRAVRIAEAAKRLDELRNNWLNPSDLVEIVPEVVAGYPDRILPKNAEAAVALKDRTLTKLYNARPQWLADAHAELDRAVAAAYGWPEDIATDDALARLLELNLSRSAGSASLLPAEDE